MEQRGGTEISIFEVKNFTYNLASRFYLTFKGHFACIFRIPNFPFPFLQGALNIVMGNAAEIGDTLLESTQVFLLLFIAIYLCFLETKLC